MGPTVRYLSRSLQQYSWGTGQLWDTTSQIIGQILGQSSWKSTLSLISGKRVYLLLIDLVGKFCKYHHGFIHLKCGRRTYEELLRKMTAVVRSPLLLIQWAPSENEWARQWEREREREQKIMTRARQVIGDEDWLNKSSCDSQLARYLIWQKFWRRVDHTSYNHLSTRKRGRAP